MPAHNLPPETVGTPTIDFHVIEIEFEPENPASLKIWLEKIIEREECRLHSLNFIFCSDEYLHRLNVEYLDHDTLTDVITFPYSEPPIVEGDIFISMERVLENAGIFKVPFLHEMRRVMAHGVFHLCGYGDKSEEEMAVMQGKEEEALTLFSMKS